MGQEVQVSKKQWANCIPWWDVDLVIERENKDVDKIQQIKIRSNNQTCSSLKIHFGCFFIPGHISTMHFYTKYG